MSPRPLPTTPFEAGNSHGHYVPASNKYLQRNEATSQPPGSSSPSYYTSNPTKQNSFSSPISISSSSSVESVHDIAQNQSLREVPESDLNRQSLNTSSQQQHQKKQKPNDNAQQHERQPSSPKQELPPKEPAVEQRPDYQVKVVCVGDGGCGKTCLMLTYTYGTFPNTYIPTVFENYLTTVRAPNNKLIELALWDTAGQEEYDRLRVLSYPEVNVLLVCFSIDSPTSLDNVVDKWVPEVSHFCPDIPFLLVGLKSDLRDPGSSVRTLITPEQGKLTAKQIGAVEYIECSARLSQNISYVFNTAISVVLADELSPPAPPPEDPRAKPAPVQPAVPVKKTKKPEIISSSPGKPKKKKKKSKCIIL
jgi:Rho family protein